MSDINRATSAPEFARHGESVRFHILPITDNDREWFTVCFIVCSDSLLSMFVEYTLLNYRQPLIPFSLKPYAEVKCTICNFSQDLS